MIIALHVLVALLSTLQAVILYFKPVQINFSIQYGLIAATVGSGTYLIIAADAHLLRTCMVGLAYLAIVTFGLILALRRKVATESITK